VEPLLTVSESKDSSEGASVRVAGLTRRKVAIAVMAMLAVVGAIGYAVVLDDRAPDVETRAKPNEAPWARLGFFSQPIDDDGVQKFEELEQWLGRDVRYFVSFGDGRSTEAFLANMTSKLQDDTLGAGGESPSFRLVHTIPLAFGARANEGPSATKAIERQWDMLINDSGGRREVYADVAQRLVEAGQGAAIIRLAHEFDGPVSRWYAGIDVEKFRQAWRVVHDIFEAASTSFTFDYNFMRYNATSPIIAEAYPGDSYVDIIGMDIYDQGWDGAGGVPAGRQAGWSDPEQVWEEYHLPNLRAHLEFARLHGKPMSFPEWGLGGGGGNQGGRAGGDDPLFIERMYDWMLEVDRNGPGLAYHAYFQGNPMHDGPHELRSFPRAERRFLELFGG
jgi:hypothetical protein